jgi:hypothetical protein
MCHAVASVLCRGFPFIRGVAGAGKVKNVLKTLFPGTPATDAPAAPRAVSVDSRPNRKVWRAPLCGSRRAGGRRSRRRAVEPLGEFRGLPRVDGHSPQRGRAANDHHDARGSRSVRAIPACVSRSPTISSPVRRWEASPGLRAAVGQPRLSADRIRQASGRRCGPEKDRWGLSIFDEGQT